MWFLVGLGQQAVAARRARLKSATGNLESATHGSLEKLLNELERFVAATLLDLRQDAIAQLVEIAFFRQIFFSRFSIFR